MPLEPPSARKQGDEGKNMVCENGDWRTLLFQEASTSLKLKARPNRGFQSFGKMVFFRLGWQDGPVGQGASYILPSLTA